LTETLSGIPGTFIIADSLINQTINLMNNHTGFNTLALSIYSTHWKIWIQFRIH
jgi:hypothetical protein